MFSKQTNVFNSLTIKWHHWNNAGYLQGWVWSELYAKYILDQAVFKLFLSIITLYPRSEVKSLDFGKLKALSKPGV